MFVQIRCIELRKWFLPKNHLFEKSPQIDRINDSQAFREHFENSPSKWS